MAEEHRGERVAALIPAAGEGTRLGLGPKAFVTLRGKTLLERAVMAFAGHVDEVAVAVAPSERARAERVLGEGIQVVGGGAARQASVHHLLQATEANLVLIHDAARPFLDPRLIHEVLAAVRQTGAVSVVTPVADTLLEAATGKTVDRSLLRAVQTPQGFARSLLLAAHERALAEGWQATDDAALVRALGREVVLVPGSAWLMKVTTPADLELAEALAERWDDNVSRRGT